jgi:hypothetical protein
MSRSKPYLLFALLCLSGCSWLHARKQSAPAPTQLIVTGVPAGSHLFIDGLQTDQAGQDGNRTRVLAVAPGAHTVEVKMGDTAYRENTYVEPGQKRVITVLSGAKRD